MLCMHVKKTTPFYTPKYYNNNVNYVEDKQPIL